VFARTPRLKVKAVDEKRSDKADAVRISEVLKVAELAEYLRVHPATVYRLLRRKQLPGFRVGGGMALQPRRKSIAGATKRRTPWRPAPRGAPSETRKRQKQTSRRFRFSPVVSASTRSWDRIKRLYPSPPRLYLASYGQGPSASAKPTSPRRPDAGRPTNSSTWSDWEIRFNNCASPSIVPVRKRFPHVQQVWAVFPKRFRSRFFINPARQREACWEVRPQLYVHDLTQRKRRKF
jgi:excisionase family DNA binding protein